MTELNHIVRRQVYELTLSSQGGAHDIQERLGCVHRETVIPLLDEVMSASVSEDFILIEQLDLDLGTLGVADLEGELPSRLEERFAEALESALKDSTSLSQSEAVRRVAADQAPVALLRWFLTSGTLPWWAPREARGPVDWLLVEPMEKTPVELVGMLRALDHDRAARRIARQFSQAPIHRLLTLLAGRDSAELSDLFADWLVCVKRFGEHGRWGDPPERIVAGEMIGALLAGRPPSGVSQRLAGALARQRSVDRAGLLSYLGRIAEQQLPAARPLVRWLGGEVGVESRGGPGRVRELGERGPASTGARDSVAAPTRPRSRRAGRPDEVEARNLPRSVAERTPVDMSGRDFGAAAETPTQEQRTSRRTTEETDAPSRHVEERDGSTLGGKLFAAQAGPTGDGSRSESMVALGIESSVGELVSNAGLVITWPFLPALFERLDLAGGEGFVSEGAHERAVLLTQLLVTGDSEIAEHELVLNKLLCGWPLEEPVAGRVDASAREVEEIGDLCGSILEHWKALGGISSEGLRTSFLAREGLLSRHELGWNLKVERVGYDVLVDQLPWAIGFVMLPWMKEPVGVEW